MSYILDALKKVEYEKNKKNRSGGRIDLSGELFKERMPAALGRNKKRALVLSAVVVSGMICLAAWFANQGIGTKHNAAVSPAAQPTRLNSPVVTPAPLTSPPQVVPVATAPVPVSPPLPSAAPMITTVADEEPGGRHGKRTKKPGQPEPAPPQQVIQKTQAPADIKLSGIAWQDDRSLRRAVINGFLLKEGAVVSGARISDIQADRVRFTSPAGTFEVRLDAVMPTESLR